VSANVGAALRAAMQDLQRAGIAGARLEARLLLGEVLRLDAAQLIAHPEQALSAADDASYRRLVAERAQRRPISHLLGRREFWGLDFRVTADTLDPRADSESVVEAALAQAGDWARPLRILDLGTGTGCLLLALLKELPVATGVGVDFSDQALAVARTNATALGLADRASFLCDSWGDGLVERSDLVISNPPYIRSDEIDGLMPEVARYEPRLALDGGSDGLASYRALAPRMQRLLEPSGSLVVEIGSGQRDSVAALFASAGLHLQAVHRDLSGTDRALVMQWNR